MSEKKVLAVASGGGHWKQLMLLREAFAANQVKYVTTIDGLPQQNQIEDFVIVKDSNKDKKLDLLQSQSLRFDFVIVKDSNKDKKLDLLITLFQLLKVIYTYKPNTIISTGAAPGLMALFIGRIFGAKTIWVDSIANSEQLSFAGRLARVVAHQVLSQWQELSDNKVMYKGSLY